MSLGPPARIMDHGLYAGRHPRREPQVAAAGAGQRQDRALPLACEVTSDPGAVILSRGDLSKHFGGLKALDGVSFSVRSNDVHALIGPNGSGKTCSTC